MPFTTLLLLLGLGALAQAAPHPVLVIPTVYGDYHFDVRDKKLLKHTDTERTFVEPAMRQQPATPTVQYAHGGTSFALRPGFYTGQSEIVREPTEAVTAVKQSVRPTTWRLSSDGKTIYIASPAIGFKDVKSDLLAIDTANKATAPVVTLGQFVSLLYLSADDKRAAVVNEQEWTRRDRKTHAETYEYRYSALRVDLAKKTTEEKVLWKEERKTGLPLAPDAFHFSPTLSKMAFRYPLADGKVAIRVVDVEKGTHEDVYESPGPDGTDGLTGPIEWSPDERQVLFSALPENQARQLASPEGQAIILVDIDGRRSNLVVKPKAEAMEQGEGIKLIRGSFDGKGFAFIRGKSKSEGTDRLYYFDLKTKEPTEIASDVNSANINYLFGAGYY